MDHEIVPLEPLEGPFASVLCVVAHPDDIEYGTAAAIAPVGGRGRDVSYFLLTRGEAGIDTMAPGRGGPRPRGGGARERAPGRCRDGGVRTAGSDGAIEYGVPLRRDIAAAVRRTGPTWSSARPGATRFGPGMINQADHRAVGLATLDAVADAGNRWLHRDLLESGLETWNGVTVYAVAGSPRPTHFVDVSGEHFEASVHSLEAHQAYNDALPDEFPEPRALLQMILGGGGQAAGVEHALAPRRCSTGAGRRRVTRRRSARPARRRSTPRRPMPCAGCRPRGSRRRRR